MDTLNILKNIASTIGYITVIGGFTITVIRPLRKKTVDVIRKANKTDDQQGQINGLSEKIDSLIERLTHQIEEDTKFREQILDDISTLKKGSALALGDMIRRIYNFYLTDKKIPEREFEIVTKTYELYHDSLHANGVIEKIYAEIITDWTVVFE